ncbi:MAG TPA: AraC family transcriptional regulator [Methanoregulaceae archaeon]|nr:AraC family transcriptional regulator [Methanoregulaceae archaeon]
MKTPDRDSIHLTSSNALPLFRSINAIAVLTRYFSKQGIDTAALLKGSGIRTDDLVDPDMLVTPAQELQVMRNLVKLVPEPGLGLTIGRQYHAGVYVKLGAALINSNTLLDAIRILFQFNELMMTYFHFDLQVKGDSGYVTMHELVDLQDIRLFVCEREFVAIHRMVSDLIGTPLTPNEIRIAYPKPPYAARYHEIIQCPIVFGAEHHVIIFDKKYLFTPLPMANPLASKTYEDECRQLSQRMKQQGTTAKRLKQEILFHRDGLPNFYQLARRMNIAPWTLKRRLSAEGTSYKQLASDILKNKAIHLLQTTDLSLEQIATELGYGDLANFYRAFRKWTGRTPGSYREKIAMNRP